MLFKIRACISQMLFKRRNEVKDPLNYFSFLSSLVLHLLLEIGVTENSPELYQHEELDDCPVSLLRLS
jgi:hypothetical protein